jgi:hypothetical protein
MRRLAFGALFLTTLSTAVAAAAPVTVDCLVPGEQSCQPDDVMARPLEEYSAHGDRVFRLTALYGLRGHDVAIEIVRPAFAAARLRLRDTGDVGEGIVAGISDADAASLFALSDEFVPLLTSPEISKRKAQAEAGPPCTDGGVVEIDLADKQQARRILADTCIIPPEFDRLLATFAAKAYALAPLCAGMDWSPPPLCLRFSGDKLAAAKVAPLVRRARGMGGDADDPSPFFSESATFSLGGTVVRGRNRIEAWIKAAMPDRMTQEPYRIEGMVDRVVVTGSSIMVRQARAGDTYKDQYLAAPFTQVWAKDVDGQYRIVSMTIGALSPDSWPFF